MDMITLFCEIHDFFLAYEQSQAQHQLPEIPETRNTRGRPRSLHPSEVMTILVLFHHKQYKNFKAYYQDYVCGQLRWAFPNLVSYSRFVQLSQEVLTPLFIFLNTRFGACSGTSFIDSTPLPVCTIVGFQHIASSLIVRGILKPLWDGSMGSNYISLSTTKVNFCPLW